MGWFDFLKKKPQKEEISCYDKMDYHYENALKVYLSSNGLEEDAEITDEIDREIMCLAVNHTGLMLTWIAEHDFYNKDEYVDDSAMLFEDIKTGKLSTIEFFLDYCDGKFWASDIDAELRPFMEQYYMNDYWNDYVLFVTEEICDLPYEVICTKEEYLNFAPKIDKAYEAFLGK